MIPTLPGSSQGRSPLPKRNESGHAHAPVAWRMLRVQRGAWPQMAVTTTPAKAAAVPPISM
jgi:hypothetical protein